MMNLKYRDIIMEVSPEPGIIVHYMEMGLFIGQHIPGKKLSDFTIKKNCWFDQNDFKSTFLSQEELVKVNGYKSLKKQIEWIAGRFLVKNMIRDYVDSDVELFNISVSYREEGAPFLEQYPFVAISITHSGDYAAVALCTTLKKIGLDIEKSDYLPDESFMKVAFTQRENTFLQFKSQEVMKLWTIKEAFLKYIGRGFHEKLHSVEVLDHEIFYNGNKIDVRLLSFSIGGRYVISLIYGSD
ncbi:MAG: 4'-phosphopantetheinyl transferase superfamily protein [Desulfamplus sp.]|nr:4'-phosphopantetheinyl transferase superfamily protein [Desulfamplus sp.]